MKTYKIGFEVTGFIEAESQEMVGQILENHLALRLGESTEVPFGHYDLAADLSDLEIEERDDD
jgi:hypothetical protein